MSVEKYRINLRTLSMIAVLVAIWIFFRLQVGEFYFNGESIAKLSRDMATWTILAAGMTLVIVSGNIDLSVGSLLALTVSTAALMMNAEYGPGLPATVAVPAALIVGTLLGLLQGTLTAYFRIPSFIVTLGGLFIFRGITQKVSAFDPRIPDTGWVQSLGFGYVSPLVGWILAVLACTGFAAATYRSRAKTRRLEFPVESSTLLWTKVTVVTVVVLGFVLKVNEYRGIPYQTIVMVIVLLALHFISRHTTFGRRLYAIGGNVEAARLSGIKVERQIVAAFAVMGCLTGVAGIVWMAQNQGSTKNAGEFYELYAIAAAIIGGTSLMGGRGTIFGTFLGGLVMATVIQGMDYSNLENWMQLVVRGAVLVIAVGIDLATKNPPGWMRRMGRRMREGLH